MAAKRDEQLQRVKDFLEVLHKLKDSGIIFSSTVLKRDVIKTIRDFYGDGPCRTLDESLGIKEEIDKVFAASMKEGAPLFIPLSLQSPPLILTRLEQLLEDGSLDVPGPSGRMKETPQEGWYLLAWVDSSSYKGREFPLTHLFNYKLAL